VNHHVVVPFSRDFSEQDAEVYIRDFLVARFTPARIVIGYDHRFGKDRAGDIRLLAALADRYDYILEEISKETIDDIAISSTKIRDALHNGQISIATRLLGYYYTLSGIVVKGQQIGRTIGYPTANLQIADPYKLIPQRGIYAVWVTVRGARYMGMLSIGYNPTFEGMEQTIEVHIVNYDGDIYGETITLEFVEYIRDEVKYDTIPELVAAIDADKVKIIQILS
jgi:riboflavin kinase/FMN adenylyltransferase